MPITVDRTVPFTADDGRAGNLIHVQGERPPSKGPVLLAHGAGVRANIFRPPVETSISRSALPALHYPQHQTEPTRTRHPQVRAPRKLG